jgi:hypothetical protein
MMNRIREDVLIAKLRTMIKQEKDPELTALFEKMIVDLERQTQERPPVKR